MTHQYMEIKIKEFEKRIKALEQKSTTHGYMLVCPNCGLYVHSDFESCPRCGAEMKSEDKENE